jgi:putative ubiquitin-RnfH superfamily antitoxin RatB of RatAB toxin-antitoxin module
MNLRITVVFSPSAGQVDEVLLSLPEGATVQDALQASGLMERHSLLQPLALPVGVWGKRRGLEDRLRDQDRVEIYRPLRVDPKEARRQRHRRHQARR